jgi:hypothetical protein
MYLQKVIISGSGSASGSGSGSTPKCHESAKLERSRVEGVVVIYFCPFCCVVDSESHGFWSDGSGSSRAKLSHRNSKNVRISCFLMLASDLAWASFMEA